MRVLKYTLQDYGIAVVPLPKGATVLSTQDQQGAVQMWCAVDESEPLESRRFEVLFTGDVVPDGREYLGTVISQGGNIVRHIFEVMA